MTVVIKGRRFSALHAPGFRRYFIGQSISLAGTWMQHTTLGWLVYSLTKSEAYLGLLGMALATPVFLFTMIGGILADRFKKRTLLMITQILSIIPAALLTIFTVIDIRNIWIILICAFLLGTINSIDIPVRQSFIIEIAGRENILGAVALNSTAFHTARVFGPAAAGIIIARYSMPICFFINALSFLPVIYAIATVRPIMETAKKPHGDVIKDIKEGFSFIIDDKRLAYLFLTLAIFNLIGTPYSQFLSVYADRFFHAGPKGLGHLMSAVGVGSAIAGIFLASRPELGSETRLMSITGALFPISLSIFAISTNIYLAYVCLAITGFNAVIFLANSNSFTQLRTSDELRGRVLSVLVMSMMGMTPVGAALIGVCARIVGLRETLVCGSILCLCGVLFLRPRWAVRAV